MSVDDRRVVSADEARQWGTIAEREFARDGWTSDRFIVDLAHTVVVQAEQIAAVLALHRPSAQELGDCRADGHSYPCPTARALGVTA